MKHHSRCEAMVGMRAYSRPGRCLIAHNVWPVDILEGPSCVRVALCAAHRKVTAEKGRVEVAR